MLILMKIPQIRKELSSYLLSEEGRISKQAIVKVGAALTFFGLLASREAAAHHVHQNHLIGSMDRGHIVISGVHQHYCDDDEVDRNDPNPQSLLTGIC